MKKKKIYKRFVSFMTASVLLANILPLDELPKDIFSLPSFSEISVSAKQPSEFAIGTITMTTHSDFIDYCTYYASDADDSSFARDHQNDTLILTFINEDSSNAARLPDNFRGLGNSTYPFAGTIEFSDLSYGYKELCISKAPFFTHVKASVQIKSDSSGSQLEFRLKRIAAEDGSYESAPLFAQHVYPCVSGADPASWWITDNGSDVSYAGVIGEIHDDAKVSLKFEKNSSIDIENKADSDVVDVGALCGVMRTGSELTAEFSETSGDYTISSDNGSAGGLVGTMEGTAELKIKDMPAVSTDKTVMSKSYTGYAGGLVGKISSDCSVTPYSSGFKVGGTAQTTTPYTIPVGGKVRANNGAGGIFGCYTNTLASNSFDVTKYDNSTVVYGKYCGGVFGVLENIKGAETAARTFALSGFSGISVTSGSSDDSLDFDTNGYFGGLIGNYTTDDLINTLELSNISFKAESKDSFAAFGGAIGIANSKAYIKADNVTVNATGTAERTVADVNGNYAYFGGLVGATSPTSGVMIDLGSFTLQTGTFGSGSSFTAEEFCGGGVVGQFNNGVLRLSGTTDMTKAKSAGTYGTDAEAKKQSYYGQLVGYNNNVLVYALGGGSDTAPAAFESTADPAATVGWRYLRSENSITDDLGTWGQVVRLFGSSAQNAQDAGIVTYNASAHTVTLAKAVSASMNTNTAFAKTALNIMLNNKSDGSGYDCLLFNSSSKSSTLLAGSLSLSDNISLAGTGLTGLTRDGSAATDPVADIGTFTGTLDGNSNAITLATGETYGVCANGQTEGTGQIYRHKFTGLFAYIGNGVAETGSKGTVKDITIGGNVYVHNAGPLGMSIGGAAARSNGNTELDGVTVIQTVNYYENRTAIGAYLGGLIGHAVKNSTDNGKIEVKGTSVIDTAFSFSGTLGNEVYCGGAIGSVSSSKIKVHIGQNADDICTVTMSTAVANGTTAGTGIPIGGLIGYISTDGTYANKKVKINNTEFGTSGTGSEACTINNPSTGTAGGLLGYKWYNTDVTIDGITVKNAELGLAAPKVGMMAYEATGKWTVNSLDADKLTMTNGGGTSLGVLVNRAFREYTKDSKPAVDGLYLDVLKSGYTLEDYDSSENTGVDLPESLGVYDEIAAYSTPAGNILSGGAGVISVNTNRRSSSDSKITATGSNGTYQNQLTSACSAALTNAKFANQYSRYYYNLDIMEGKSTKNGGDKLVLWSVHNYAASNISGEFSNTSPLSNSNLTAVDLSGLSFYPIPDAGSTTLKNVNITFDYSGIYTAETDSTNDTDDYTRDPGDTGTSRNQHYLMQSGLFMNQPQVANGDQTITLAGTVKLGGTFLELSGYKGVLVSQTMNGSLDTTGSVVLNGLTPKTTGNASYANEGYLLVNQIVTDTGTNMKPPTITVKELSTEGYLSPTTAVARSLFGTASGTGLTITFDKIKLDARTAALSESTKDEDMTTAYGTSRSIFSQATFFDSIYTDKDASLIYNYTHDEDWGTGTPREVTYGKEVYSSTEYPNKEKKYFESQIYTNPTNVNEEYDFATNGFLPYVRQAYTAPAADATQYYREIKVNVQGEEMGRGCGTYNDPYVITSGAQLEAIAKFLFDHKATDISQIYLPTTEKNGVAANASGDRWCSSNHAAYTPYSDNSKFTSTTPGAAEWTAENAALYLASAYYQIGDPNATAPVTGISLSSNFIGLGATSDNTESGKYAFRGVIVGAKDSSTSAPTITITNASENPLIKVSNGSVIKNLNIVNTKASIEREQKKNTSADASFGYISNCEYYGGIIGEVMGGDNIIDNSYVTFSGSTVKLSGTNGTIVPVGGYVGVVVYGAVIFKNMTQTVSGSDTLRVNSSGLTVYYGNNTDNLTDSTNSAYMSAIYVNPIVGRVINGYAVNETANRFSVTEDGTYHDDANNGAGSARTAADGSALNQHTLKNGKKHYSIADINKNEANKLSLGKEVEEDGATVIKNAVPTSSEDGIINVPNAQALFILSLITQSCAGTATENGGDYTNSLSYGIYSTNVHGMSHNASYDDVGTNLTLVTDNPATEDIDETSVPDYQKSACNDTAASTAIPYIIRHYTVVEEKTIRHYDDKGWTLSFDDNGTTQYLKVSGDKLLLDTTPYYFNSITKVNGKWRIQGTSATNGNPYYVQCKWTYGFAGATSPTDVGAQLDLYSDGNIYTNDTIDGKRFYISNKRDGSTGTQGARYYLKGTKSSANDRWISQTTNINEAKLVTFHHDLTDYYENSLTVFARCVTSTEGYYNINLKEGVDYTLPDSYRGLGCVGIYDSKAGSANQYCMKVNKFDGKGCTIDEDIYLNRRLEDNYFDVLHDGAGQSLLVETASAKYYKGNGKGGEGLADCHGIGLFDSVIMKYSSTNTDSEIGNFKLTGSVNTEVFENEYDSTSKEWKDVKTIGDATRSLWLSTGGVCGWSTNGTYAVFSKIELNGLRVRGSNLLGGLLGFSGIGSTTVKVIIKECTANDISIEMNAASILGSLTQTRSAIGAFVGKVQEGAVVIYGTSDGENNEDLTKNSTVTIKSLGFADNTKQYYTSTGGLVGFAGHCCQVYDMMVTSGSNGTVTIGNSNVRFSGGLVGAMQSFNSAVSGTDATTAIARFKNCTVQNLNVAGEFAGGFYGGKWDSLYTPYIIELENCKMEGKSASEKNTIIANKLDNNPSAGGFIGRGIVKTSAAEGKSNITISNCKVSNYSITAVGGESDADKGVAGGFVGYCQSFNGGSTITCYIHDSSVENSVIGAAGAFSFGGGAIGWVNPKDTSKENKMLGYNIKLDNVSTNSEDKANMGAWVGYLGKNDKKTSIRFNGIAIYGTGYEKNIGNWTVTENQANTNTSFIFADYTGACESITTPSQVHTSGYNDENNVNSGTPTYPYVNVNPHQTMGTDGTTTEYISSDAAVLYDTDNTKNSFSEVTGTAKDTMAAKIYHDLEQEEADPTDPDDNFSRRYTTFDKTATIKAGETNTIVDYLNGTAGEDADRISTYSTERNGLPTDYTGKDFAVVVISNTDNAETTGLINRYIQLVTNTSTATNYAADDTYYNVEISTCKYSSGKFSLEPSLTPGIENVNNEFRLVGASADANRKDTFTLLDIQFKDPLDTDKVAYHLYVPVFTRKQLNFGFAASALSETNSVKIPGANIYEAVMSTSTNQNSVHIDGLDSWITQYIRFTYEAIDLNILLDSNSVNWNHEKYVLFNTYDNVTQKLPGDTYMLLVDPNGDRDKVYYLDSMSDFEADSTENGASGGWKIDLHKFRRDRVPLEPNAFSAQLAGKIEASVSDDTSGNYILGTSDDYDVYMTDSSDTITYFKYSEGSGTYDLTIPGYFDEVNFNELIAKDISQVPSEGGNTGAYDLYIEGSGASKDVYRIDPTTGDKVYYTYVPEKTGAYDLKVPNEYVLNEDYYLSMYVPLNDENDDSVFFYSINSPGRLEGDFAAVLDNNKKFYCNLIICRFVLQ